MPVLNLGVLLASTTKPEPVLAAPHQHLLSWRPGMKAPHHPVCLLRQARKQEEGSNVWNEILWCSLAYADLSFNMSIWLRQTHSSESVVRRRAAGGCCTGFSVHLCCVDLTPPLARVVDSCLLFSFYERNTQKRLALLWPILNGSCFVFVFFLDGNMILLAVLH